MLYHNKCTFPLSLNLSKHVEFISSFGFVRSGLKVNTVEVDLKREEFPAEFICRNCKEIVEEKNIISICLNCGEKFTLDKIYKPSRSNGCYCEKCAEPFHSSGESLTQISKLISKVTFK